MVGLPMMNIGTTRKKKRASDARPITISIVEARL